MDLKAHDSSFSEARTALVADKPRISFIARTDWTSLLVLFYHAHEHQILLRVNSNRDQEAKACPLLLAARMTAITKARARANPTVRSTRSSSSRAVRPVGAVQSR